MNRKLLYLQVRGSLLAQNVKSQRNITTVEVAAGNYRSLYFSPNGLKCSIGHLMLDSEYSPEMEGRPLKKDDSIFSIFFKRIQAKTDDDYSFLRQLQEIHDGLPVNRWEEELDILAKKWNLQ